MIEDASASFFHIKEELDALGITEFCREVFRSTQKAMTPLEVRAALLARGIDLGRQKNIMASIHTVLKRLVAQRYLVIETAADGGTAYRNPMPRPTFPGRVRRLKVRSRKRLRIVNNSKMDNAKSGNSTIPKIGDQSKSPAVSVV